MLRLIAGHKGDALLDCRAYHVGGRGAAEDVVMVVVVVYVRVSMPLGSRRLDEAVGGGEDGGKSK